MLGRFALLRRDDGPASVGVYGGPGGLELVCVILLVHDIPQGFVKDYTISSM